MDVGILLFLMASGFVAAFIDSVVGGGGLISLPALLMTGLPPVHALGTNKMASLMGTLTSTLSFLRSGKIDLKLMRYLFPLSLAGGAVGVCVVRLIPPHFLKPLLVVMLVGVMVYTLCKKEFGAVSSYRGLSRREGILSGVLVFLLGFYDGFFGPGGGTFLIFGFLLIGFDYVCAAANSRVANFASNLAATVVFGWGGLIDFHYALPMGLAMAVGAWAGAHVAIHKGVTYVRPLFLVVTTLLIGKQLWTLFF
ncbi:MAG: TSUP family transporter [Negativicutes bacterium]|nr:TSUP family transporter [Negativicutes bacterium]